MRKLILIVLIAFGFTFVPAQIDKDSAALQEAQKISTQVVGLFKEKKYAEALPLARKAVSIREKELGKRHPLVAQAWRNLAYIQMQMKGREEAKESFKKAFEIYENTETLATSDEKMYAEMLETVAVYEATDGDIIGAEKKLKRAVELDEKLYGEYALETANGLIKLAQIYQIKGDYERAAPLLLRALDIKAAKLGIKDSQTDKLYDNASCALKKLDMKDKADRLREKYYPRPTNIVGESDGGNSQVKAGVINSRALNLVKPVYPSEARKERAKGKVEVEVTIDEKGEVIYACATSGALILQRVSEIAAYQSKFTPTLLSGIPVKVRGVIVYNFVP